MLSFKQYLIEGKGEDYFSPRALEGARNQSSKSREVLIQMHPRDFLNMAERLPAPHEAKLNAINTAIDSGKKLSDIPHLSFVHDEKGNAYVTGHEGRHRALALIKRGATTMPVRLESDTARTPTGTTAPAIRWGQYEGELPKHLHSQDKTTSIPFPVGDLRNPSAE